MFVADTAYIKYLENFSNSDELVFPNVVDI